MSGIKQEVVQKMFAIQVASEEEVRAAEEARARETKQVQMSGPSDSAPSQLSEQARRQEQQAKPQEETRPQKNESRPVQQEIQAVRVGPKVGRNDPCPCGSGKKHKQCCGK